MTAATTARSDRRLQLGAAGHRVGVGVEEGEGKGRQDDADEAERDRPQHVADKGEIGSVSAVEMVSPVG